MNTLVPYLKQSSLLQAVLEGFIDGILVLTEQGEWLHANNCARQICQRLTQSNAPSNLVPQEIWRACQALMEGFGVCSNKTALIEDEITIAATVTYRVRAQWLQLEDAERPCMLVTLEDRYQSIQSLAIAEAQKYGLTPREADVWLRYRANYTYKEIAAELYITQNTVKKHMKNIHAKRLLTLDTDE